MFWSLSKVKSMTISDFKSKGHLSLTADSEIMWDKQSVTCNGIGNIWFVIQESQVDRLIKYDQKDTDVGISPRSFNVLYDKDILQIVQDIVTHCCVIYTTWNNAGIWTILLSQIIILKNKTKIGNYLIKLLIERLQFCNILFL